MDQIFCWFWPRKELEIVRLLFWIFFICRALLRIISLLVGICCCIACPVIDWSPLQLWFLIPCMIILYFLQIKLGQRSEAKDGKSLVAALEDLEWRSDLPNWKAPNISTRNYSWTWVKLSCGITLDTPSQGYKNKRNDHLLRKLLIVRQILLVSTLKNLTTVWRICVLTLGCKGLSRIFSPVLQSLWSF